MPIRKFITLLAFCLTPLQVATACNVDIDGYNFAVVDPNETRARAEITECSRGALSYYDFNSGWQPMYWGQNDQMVVQDLYGVNTPYGLLLVAIGGDDRLLFRYGEPGPQFFLNDQSHSTFYGKFGDGRDVVTARITDVRLQPPQNNIIVQVLLSSGASCAIASDPQGVFRWHTWYCTSAG